MQIKPFQQHGFDACSDVVMNQNELAFELSILPTFLFYLSSQYEFMI